MHRATMHPQFHIHNMNTNQYYVLMGHDDMYFVKQVHPLRTDLLPPPHWYMYTKLHSAMSQKILILLLTAMKTSDFT
jgi:hypothetical protein